MATVTLYPNVINGVSITVSAEDGVTPITAAGAIVTLIQEVTGGPDVVPAYYRNLCAQSKLVDRDPLGLSGDPITVPSVTRVSAGLISVLTAALITRATLGVGEILTTSGYADSADGGGDEFVSQGIEVPADGYFVLPGPNCVWARTKTPYTVEINVNKFGIISHQTMDQSAAFQALVNATYPPIVAEFRIHTFYFPAGYYILKNIEPLVYQPLVIRGDPVFANPEQYGSSAWEIYRRTGGTMLYGDGSDVFKLENDAPEAANYRFLTTKDIAIVTRGSGICVHMSRTEDWTTPNGQAAQGGCWFSDNTVLAGGAIGAIITSYANSTHHNLKVYGCNVGLQLGVAVLGNPGCQPASFYNLEVQSCNYGVDFANASGVNIYGGLFQGNDVHFRFPANAVNRTLALHGIYAENGKTFEVHATANPGDFAMYDSRFTGTTGTSQLYGNGWHFHRSFPGPIQHMDQTYGNVYDLSVPDPPLTAPNFSEIRRPDVCTGHAAHMMGTIGTPLGPTTVNIDTINNGDVIVATLAGDVEFVLPINDRRVLMLLTQDGTGGWDVTFSGSGVDITINNAGNVAGAELVVHAINWTRAGQVAKWRLASAQIGWS